MIHFSTGKTMLEIYKIVETSCTSHESFLLLKHDTMIIVKCQLIYNKKRSLFKIEFLGNSLR